MRELLTKVLLGSACALAILAAPAGAQAKPGYVALGDSYSSGVGTGSYYADSGECQRSRHAYGPLIAAARGYALSFKACSGATTPDVISSQLGPLNASTSLVTITIGGNDAGFATGIFECAALSFPCQSAIDSSDAFIEHKLPALLDTTYSDIRAGAPNARVVVLGYPHLFTSRGATCDPDLLTPRHEREINHSGDLLDGVIATRAAAHGFTYVDPRRAFESHEICSSSPWLNGLTLPLSDSFHPDIAGQAEFASLIEAVL